MVCMHSYCHGCEGVLCDVCTEAKETTDSLPCEVLAEAEETVLH
jgi:hypothetical protein